MSLPISLHPCYIPMSPLLHPYVPPYKLITILNVETSACCSRNPQGILLLLDIWVSVPQYLHRYFPISNDKLKPIQEYQYFLNSACSISDINKLRYGRCYTMCQELLQDQGEPVKWNFHMVMYFSVYIWMCILKLKFPFFCHWFMNKWENKGVFLFIFLFWNPEFLVSKAMLLHHLSFPYRIIIVTGNVSTRTFLM